MPKPNEFVHTVLEAYNNHRALTLRPDDVWTAILIQFSFFRREVDSNGLSKPELPNMRTVLDSNGPSTPNSPDKCFGSPDHTRLHSGGPDKSDGHDGFDGPLQADQQAILPCYLSDKASE
ncbi:hypothetical protein BDR06DRAFT_975080 [Suillus hirtellus]|nr:hypothetical protein BDR06DRAFT_975080 [Suillus hirtellus]